MLKTSLTRELGIELPIVGAGMGFLALPELVAAVSEGGGLGLLGVSPAPAPQLAAWTQEIRALTARPFGVDLIVEDTAFGPSTTEEHIEVCLREQVGVVVFFWNPPPTEWAERLLAAGCRIWMQVGAVDAALAAVDLGASAVIVQGCEAGGHNRSEQGLMALLPRVVDALGSVPVLAAGGIADGRGVAAALALGAQGVVVGTRLVASREAVAHQEYKRRLVSADVGDVARTRIFGPEWPDAPMNVLRNRAVAEAESSEVAGGRMGPIGRTKVFGQDYEMPRHSAMLPTPATSGDFDEMCLPAGAGVGLISGVESASMIVRRLADEAADVLATLAPAPAGA